MDNSPLFRIMRTKMAEDEMFACCPACRGGKIQFEALEQGGTRGPLVPVPCHCCSGTGQVHRRRVCIRCGGWRNSCQCYRPSTREIQEYDELCQKVSGVQDMRVQFGRRLSAKKGIR